MSTDTFTWNSVSETARKQKFGWWVDAGERKTALRKGKIKLVLIVMVFLALQVQPVKKRGVGLISAYGPEWDSPPAPLHGAISARTNVTRCQTFLSSRRTSRNSTQKPSTKPTPRSERKNTYTIQIIHFSDIHKYSFGLWTLNFHFDLITLPRLHFPLSSIHRLD